jgi:hypothetical protein
MGISCEKVFTTNRFAMGKEGWMERSHYITIFEDALQASTFGLCRLPIIEREIILQTNA